MDEFTKSKYVPDPMKSDERDKKFCHLNEKYAPAMEKLAGNDLPDDSKKD